MTKPKEAIPFQGQDNGPAKSEAPAAAVVAEPAVEVRHFDPKKSFTGTKALDRMKGYLRDVPVLRQELISNIESQKEILAASCKALDKFTKVTKRIEETVDRWEAEEQEKKESAEASKSS